MFERTEAAIEAMQTELAELNGGGLERLDGGSALLGLKLWATAKNIAAAGVTALAGRVEATDAARLTNARDAKDAVATALGTSKAAAEKILDNASRLAEMSTTQCLFAEGTLSEAEVTEIAAATARNKAAESDLVGTAQEASFAKLREKAAGVVCPDPKAEEARHRAAMRRRCVRTWTDAEGLGHAKASGPTDLIGALMARLDALADERFVAARSSGNHQPAGAYRFDALLALVGLDPLSETTGSAHGAGAQGGAGPDGGASRRPAGGSRASDPTSSEAGSANGSAADSTADSPPTKTGPAFCTCGGRRLPKGDLLMRIDMDAWLRGYARADQGEHCEIDGLGPVPVSAIADRLGDAVVRLIITRGKDIRTIVHPGRGINAHLRTALAWGSSTCAVDGCDRRLGLQIDHVRPVGKGGPTAWENLQPLCAAHHREKTKRDYPNGTAAYRGKARARAG